MSGASAIATSKITNGTMIGQFGSAAAKLRTEIMLPLDLSRCDPSMKLGFVALREPLEKAGRASLIARVSMASVANARRLRRRSREQILHGSRDIGNLRRQDGLIAMAPNWKRPVRVSISPAPRRVAERPMPRTRP